MLNRLILLLTTLLLSSCISSTPIQNIAYEGNLPIYPAVYKVFHENNTSIHKANIFEEEFTSGYINKTDLLIGIRFKLLTKKINGEIQTTAVYLQREDKEKHSWKDSTITLAFDINKFTNEINAKINKYLNDSSIYNVEKDIVITDLEFNHTVLRDLTEVGREKWIDNNIKGKIFTFNLPLLNFENNNNKRINKKYVATLRYNLKNSYTRNFHINLYTNNDQYSTLGKGSVIKTKGELLSAYSNSDNFSLYLVELN